MNKTNQQNKKLVMFDFGGTLAGTKGITDQVLYDAMIPLSQRYIISIISSTPSDHIVRFLAERGIREYFSDILGVDIHKDKTIKIKSLLQKYTLTPAEAVYITDSVGDIEEARKCGVVSMAVSWGFEDKEALDRGNPVMIVDNPNDLFLEIQNVLQ